MTWAFFDLNGTLLDPEDLEPSLRRALQFAWASTLAGDYQPFDVLVGWALGAPVGDRLERMPARPGARDCLEALGGGGIHVAVLTQSRTETARRALEHAGLLDAVEMVLGTDQVEAFKPDPRPYAHAVVQSQGPPSDAWLVAAHWWDVLGAKRAGMRTAFVGERAELPGVVPLPDVVAPDLPAAAVAILAATGD